MNPDVEHLYTQLGRAYEMANEWEKSRGAYETMLALAREAGEARLEVVALNYLANLAFRQEASPARARTLLEEARWVAEEAGLTEELAETECNLVDVMVYQTGEFGRFRPIAKKALASARALDRQPLVARALSTLTRLEKWAGRMKEAAAYAEEGVALNRRLAEYPPDARTKLPSMLTRVTGLSISWRAGAKAMEIECLVNLASVRIYQGRPQEGMAIAGEAQAISKDLPERMEMMSLWALGMGLQEVGEYEEALMLARRGTERAREVGDTYLLGANLGRVGEAYEALMNLEEARAAYEEAAERGHYGPFSHARFCVVAALSEDWEDAYAHAKRAYEIGMFFIPMFSLHLHREVEALLRGGDEDLAREEVRRFAECARTNERDRMAYLRSLAVLSDWEGDTTTALGQLQEAQVLAEKIGLPGELWQIGARIGELHERRGEASEAHQAFSRAAQTLRDLAAKIKDEELREGFLAAPRIRRLLDHH